MRVAVIGSRDFPRLAWVHKYVRKHIGDGDVLISGGARGVDQHAEHAAKERGLECLIFPADWDGKGKGAGMIRNAEIVANCDRLVAFHDGHSTGTAHTIRLAKEQGKRVEICYPDGKVERFQGQERELTGADLRDAVESIFKEKKPNPQGALL